jgi:hypothetical protein
VNGRKNKMARKHAVQIYITGKSKKIHRAVCITNSTVIRVAKLGRFGSNSIYFFSSSRFQLAQTNRRIKTWGKCRNRRVLEGVSREDSRGGER